MSSKVTQAAQILAFLTFWVIQFVTLIIRADQHIFGKCCSAESENSLHRREDFNQEAVAKQAAWALLFHSPPYKVGLGLLHRSQGSRLQNWLLKHVNSCTKVTQIYPGSSVNYSFTWFWKACIYLHKFLLLCCLDTNWILVPFQSKSKGLIAWCCADV